MCSASFFIEMKCIVKEMFSQRKKSKKFSGNWQRKYCSRDWKLSEAWLLKKDSVTFSRLLKLLKLKKNCLWKNSITTWQLLKFLILKKGLRHFLTTFTVINAKKDLITFLWILKILILKKGCITFLRLLQFNIEKGQPHFLETLTGLNHLITGLHHILMTLKSFSK